MLLGEASSDFRNLRKRWLGFWNDVGDAEQGHYSLSEYTFEVYPVPQDREDVLMVLDLFQANFWR